MTFKDQKVSVVIPAYNEEEAIGNIVAAVIERELVLEVVVVDDGSKDKTIQILSELKKSTSKLLILEHGGNVHLGVSASRNLAISKAAEPFICFLDADDFFAENRFSKTATIFKANPGVHGIVENYREFYNDSISFAGSSAEKDKPSYVNPSGMPLKEVREAFVQGKIRIMIGTSTIRTSSLKTVDFFNEKMRQFEDTDFWVRFILKNNVVVSPDRRPVLFRRLHESNVSNAAQKFEWVSEEKLWAPLVIWSKYEVANRGLEILLLKRFITGQISYVRKRTKLPILFCNFAGVMFAIWKRPEFFFSTYYFPRFVRSLIIGLIGK